MGKEIGIDLGTTNTVVSYVNKKGKLRQLSYDNNKIIPSVIYFKSRSEYFIGDKARKFLAQNPSAGVSNFKTKMGSSDKYDITPEEGAPFSLRSREISKLFLNKIVNGLSERLLKEFGSLDGTIEKAIITVPAKFSSTEKGETRRAARDAGLDTVKLAPEPTAAAIAYEDAQGGGNPNSVILVYDFGGGTFDVSIIRRNGNTFEEIATGGDKSLGGNILTKQLVEEILENLNDDYGINMTVDEEDFSEDDNNLSLKDYRLNMSEITFKANRIKERLSEEDEVSEYLDIRLPDNKSTLQKITFTRDDLEDFIRDYIRKTVEITKNTIKDANARGVENIDQIVLAGGSSNIPLVKESLEACLQDHDIVFCDDVNTLISRGAAVMAYKDNITSKAITNVDMGIAAHEGMTFAKFLPIIPVDEPLPCTRKEIFRLSKNNQRQLKIEYYERDIKTHPRASRVSDDGIEQIDTLVINDLPPGLRADDTAIEVEFTAQKDGSLDIHVVLTDKNGAPIKDGTLSVAKKSELENE